MFWNFCCWWDGPKKLLLETMTDEVKEAKHNKKQKTRVFKHTIIPFILLLLMRGIKDILVNLLNKRINSISFCSPFHPYDYVFVSELCREQLHCPDWQTCWSTTWHPHYLCILISFSIPDHTEGKKIRLGGDGVHPDLLMEASTKKATMQALELCWAPTILACLLPSLI